MKEREITLGDCIYAKCGSYVSLSVICQDEDKVFFDSLKVGFLCHLANSLKREMSVMYSICKASYLSKSGLSKLSDRDFQ